MVCMGVKWVKGYIRSLMIPHIVPIKSQWGPMEVIQRIKIICTKTQNENVSTYLITILNYLLKKHKYPRIEVILTMQFILWGYN